MIKQGVTCINYEKNVDDFLLTRIINSSTLGSLSCCIDGRRTEKDRFMNQALNP